MAEFDPSKLEYLTEPECQIGETQFFFDKLGAMEAWRILERIRHELSRTNLGEIGDVTVLVRAILALDPAFIERLRRDLFEHVRFVNTKALSPQSLLGAEDMAFEGEGVEPVAVYEVLVRSLAVNFTGSFGAVVSQFGDEPPSSSPLLQ